MKKLVLLFALAAALCAVACGGPASPSDTATEIYSLVMDGKYEQAVDLFYFDENKPEEAAQAKAVLTALLTEKAKPQIEAKGGIKAVEIVEEVIAEDGKSATVSMKITYGDDSVTNENLELILTEAGEWKADMNK